MLWRLLLASLIIAFSVGIGVERAVTRTEVVAIGSIESTDATAILAVEGKITAAEANTFMLSDSTGSARLSTCPLWYKRVEIYPGDRVTVIGRVLPEAADGEVKLMVFKILHDGEEIVIREQAGKPPWISASY